MTFRVSEYRLRYDFLVPGGLTSEQSSRIESDAVDRCIQYAKDQGWIVDHANTRMYLDSKTVPVYGWGGSWLGNFWIANVTVDIVDRLR
jgi:hypothetical protein